LSKRFFAFFLLLLSTGLTVDSLLKVLLKIDIGDWPAEKITLSAEALVVHQIIKLLSCFNPFSKNLESKPMGHGANRFSDCGITFSFVEVLDE